MTHLISILIPKVANNNNLSFWRTCMDICNQSLKIFFKVCCVYYILSKLYSHKV